MSYFSFVLVLAALTELIKGLSANGTPPVLQRFSWQIDLAYFMWTNIILFRSVFGLILVGLFWYMPTQAKTDIIWFTIIVGGLWFAIYWLFNRFWIGKYKFLPISQKTFASAAKNQVDPSIQVLGVDYGGNQKAYPINMLFYHHQISDEIAGHPIAATYCGMCRSGRVYDALVNGMAFNFALVGAITYNAILRDDKTGTWWRQETGEAAKGPLKGTVLEDIPFEQMSLANWIEKHPDTQILQYDPAFAGKYKFLAGLLNYEHSLPGWHMQKTPPLVIGIEIDGAAKAYDWEQLKKVQLVSDMVGASPLLVIADAESDSGFVYEREIDGEMLEFTIEAGTITDTKTGSQWDHLGRCHKGKLKGKTLRQVQSYRQFVRAWLSFHSPSDFYQF